MVLPRSGLATKGIVPFDLIKHDLIKSFSLPDWIKDFPDEDILNAKVTSSADFFIVEMKDYITTSTRVYFDYICVARQSVCMGDKFPTGSAGYCVVTKGASPKKS